MILANSLEQVYLSENFYLILLMHIGICRLCGVEADFVNSDLLVAMEHDVNLFGKEALNYDGKDNEK